MSGYTDTELWEEIARLREFGEHYSGAAQDAWDRIAVLERERDAARAALFSCFEAASDGAQHEIDYEQVDLEATALQAVIDLRLEFDEADMARHEFDCLVDVVSRMSVMSVSQVARAAWREVTVSLGQGLHKESPCIKRMDEALHVLAALAAGSASPEESPEPCPSCGPEGTHDISFDRSLCACGAMHYYCVECGRQTDPCAAAVVSTEPTP